MPKIIIPAPPEVEGESLMNMLDGPGMRTIFLPANDEILAAIELGDEIRLKIVAKVRTKEQREREMGQEDFQEFGVELRSVDVITDNDFEKMADEDDD